MKKLAILLCLLSLNAWGDDFRMKCKSVQSANNATAFVLCEDEVQSCFISRVWGQKPFCTKK